MKVNCDAFARAVKVCAPVKVHRLRVSTSLIIYQLPFSDMRLGTYYMLHFYSRILCKEIRGASETTKKYFLTLEECVREIREGRKSIRFTDPICPVFMITHNIGAMSYGM